MDLRNFTSNPNQLDIQRRPSLSSLSTTSGYGSSTYGANGHSNGATPQLNGHNSRTNAKNLSFGDINSSTATPNAWSSGENSLNDVAPWVEQQKQHQSKVGSLDIEKDKKDKKSEKSKDRNGDDGPKAIKDDDSFDDDHDDDLIPTAIVIKNIPFAIKKEQLLDVMTKLSLPLPYAFNYHFDNGVFRGLAFANFTSTDETSLVVNQLNGREIGGRKLRVEYKKMLPAQERERIEREKREKRGQLEEQHRSNSNASLASLMSTTSTTAATKNLSVNGSNASQPERLFMSLPSQTLTAPIPNDVNFNDIETLELYTQLVVFKDDNTKTIMELAYPPNLGIAQRKLLSSLCSWLNLLELYDNGLIIIRRKPGQSFQVLDIGPVTAEAPVAPTAAASSNPTGSMLNLNHLGQTNGMGSINVPGSIPPQGHGHPELLRSHSQSALPLPRLRQQNSTPIQGQFPQYSANSSSGSKSLYQSIQPFGFIPANQPNLLPTQLSSNSNFSPSTSAAAILRNGTTTSRPPYGDIRSTPPLNSFGTESPTPTPQQTHSSLFNPGSNSGSNSGTSPANPSSSQPSTPLQSHDINSRFAPFGQHPQAGGSLSSLPRHGDEFNDLSGKFNTISLNYDASTASNSGSGIWGPK
ncbi:hypothetical protein CANTEDRAFT_124688 [Yamadazyma tenuis ATCC 10573]|uniref:RRM domain-containing protein n=1 Tax=Candida tenuis (strain ATCC 10573 / BCRC 21748 / CBS 615 / JCM 9827 / NBRC 10315 / NRRL Y-1498 / VKM Y-70) TaxID=590646 RepID=G3B7Z0_CANTC|nr:uncharacterized protein CANTEDRAFT_124688 [Yamadazyma tenuis ATCC 10573]EGV61691.1 hypothetical protein CANTEDRAFT_124688 [Yamadazyma tenuis ATCC 10573]